ncbi:MAG: efflux RND transporter periplasmic adaptor subunit [Candidatus Omnitrophota bacterium]|nr:efflux RND transporter periplasmic adaptor subunit [Candidatus Omnitrophota bacterium]
MLFTVSGCGRKEVDKAAQKKIMYHCPMHPQYTSDKPGDCPICGMKLVKMETKPEPAQALKTPAASPEKAIEEVCVEHKCTMKGCTMDVKARLKPGERVICPICGEVIATTSGKVVEIVKTSAVRETPSAGKERKVLYYRNPMNPQATSSVPAKDSMGMDYVPVYEEGARPETAGPTVMISPEKQQLIGVRTEPVGKRDLKKVVRASGKIAYDPELVITQEEFIQALANEGNTKDSPLRDVIDRAKLLTNAAKAKLKLLGMSDEQIAGLVITKKAETNLYLPGKDESVWAYISIYEYEIGLVKPQAEVEIEAVAYPGEIFKGTVVSINPVLDPMTRTNQVRVEIPAPDNKLKPEMFVNAKIYADLGEKLAVPESAILDTGLRKIVYLSEADNVLEQREITVGQKAEGYQEILGGLKEGDIVVTSGNFLIDSEAKLKSASQ